MRWTAGDRSNVEDARGGSGFRMGGAMPIGIGGVVILGILTLLTGRNFFALISPDSSDQPAERSAPANHARAGR